MMYGMAMKWCFTLYPCPFTFKLTILLKMFRRRHNELHHRYSCFRSVYTVIISKWWYNGYWLVKDNSCPAAVHWPDFSCK